MTRAAFAVAAVVSLLTGTASAKPKKCQLDPKVAVDNVPAERLHDVATGDPAPVSALFDVKANALSLLRTLDGAAVATVALPAKLPAAKILGFERAATGYVAIVGTPPPAKGATTANTVKPTRYLVRWDGKTGTAKELPVELGEIRGLVALGTTTVIADPTAVRAFDANGKLIGVASAGTDLGPVARLGGDLGMQVAIVDVGDDDKSVIRVFDGAQGVWLEAKAKLPEAPAALVSFGTGVLTVAIIPGKGGTSSLQGAILKADGKLGAWQKWYGVASGNWMDASGLVVQRAPGGDVFVQWSKQLTSGMGRDDTSHYFGAHVQPDGKLGPASKQTDNAFQPSTAVATDDGLYLVPIITNKTHGVWRWSCK